VDAALDGRRTGASVEVRWISRGEERRATVKLVQDETLAGSLDGSASDEAKRFRASWKEGNR
jgi:hypothetical protein